MLRGKRLGIVIGAAFGALALLAPAAQANHHLMTIREVYPGIAGNRDSAYVELQMYSPGQNFVSGQSIKVYNSAGTTLDTFTMNANVANGQNQRTVLIADSSPFNGVTADFTNTTLGDVLVPAGGAVCFTSISFGPIDCVSWGGFNANSSLPSSAGTPAPEIVNGDGLTRSIQPGCATLLEGADDTGQSSADFSLTAVGELDPRPNSVAPTEQACVQPKPPNTKLTSKPSAKTNDRTPTFKFKTTPAAGATFQCKLDTGSYKSCKSPFTTKKLSFGKHSVKVRAKNANGTDPSAAKASFKVIKKPN